MTKVLALRLYFTRYVVTRTLRSLRRRFILCLQLSTIYQSTIFLLVEITDRNEILESLLSILGEPTDSTLVLKLRGLFSVAEIYNLLLDDEPSEYDQDSEDKQSLTLERCAQKLSELIECLFWTLPTIEMVFRTVLARQKQNPALDEREMLLLKSESDISLSSMGSDPIRELLKVDLELIAAMRESLKDTKYAEYMGENEPAFDPKQLYKELGEGSAQIKYWTSKIAEEEHGITQETQAAMTLNLARIARVFSV